MAPFEQLFQHLPDYKVIICYRCRYAVVPAQVNSHIQRQHPSITKEDQRAIVQAVADLSDLATAPEHIQWPHLNDRHIEELPVYQDGLHCVYETAGEECGYVCRDLLGMQRHCNTQHQWKNPRRRGGNPQYRRYERTGQVWIANQPCQRLFQARQWPQYFAVQVEGDDASDIRAGQQAAGQQIEGVIDQLFERFGEAQQKDHGDIRRRYEPNPWLEHTMWERHIGPHKAWVVKMIEEGREEGEQQPISKANKGERRQQPISEANEGERRRQPIGEANSQPKSEEGLRVACKATALLIRQSYQVSRVEIVGRPAMQYINRRETGAPTSDRPFYAKQKVQTIRRYTDQFVKILRYIWRTEAMSKRPKYRLTDTQQGALTNLRRVAGDAARRKHIPSRERSRLVECSGAFWVTIFDHPLGDDEYESAVMSGLAVLGAAGDNGGWMPAVNYTPILAAMITTMRAIVIRRAWRVRQDQIDTNIRNGITKEYAHQGVVSVFEIVKRDVERFMTSTAFGGRPMPMNTIYTQKMYGMKIRYTTKAEGQIWWQGSDRVLVRKIQFSMDDIRSVVHGLVTATRRQLVEELLLLPVATQAGEWRPQGMPMIDVQKIFDNHRSTDEGWSFLKDVRNEWPVDGSRWMGLRLGRDDKVRKQFVARPTGASIRLEDEAVHKYIRAVRKFKERLMVLVHMSAGAPARSTELISGQCENGKHARSQRGIFVDDGLVVFVTTYHKGFSASQSMKIVHRFVPYEVGEIVVYYLWLIRPFEQILQGFDQKQDVFSSWLWEPEPEEEWGGEGDAFDDQEEGDESDEEQVDPVQHAVEWDEVDVDVGNTSATIPQQEPRNCDGFWNTDRVRRVMRRETGRLIGVPIGISDWRQVYPAIHREFATDHSIRETLSKIYENSNPTSHDDEAVPANNAAAFRAKQAGHSFQMEEDIYGRSLEQSPWTTTAEKDAFRRVSVDWHRFLQFPSAWQMDSVDPDVRQRVKQEQDDARLHRFQQMRQIDIKAELRRMYSNPQAEFRGVQEDALKLIVGGCARVVVVMRTGGGKSLLFMLPAAASKGGVTIVVVPKVALESNMQQRCIEAGIKCAIWSDDRAPPYDARIVFVVAESAISQSFADFINSKKAAHQLERIVIDECHTILQSNENWRPKVLQLRELAGQDVQVVCLTATLPPQKEDRFLEAMDMRVDGLQLLRDVTIRPNIAYSVLRYDAEDEVEFVRELVEQKKAQYPALDKIVIYCRKIDQVKEFAEVLGATAFWRGVGSKQEKAEILEKLTKGEERVFTSTSALGEGIDAPNIRVVIHIGVIDSLDDYGQQSGRAGRDGKTASEAIILHKVGVGKDGRRRPEQGWKTEAEMKEFLSGNRCKRIILDRYMDGVDARTSCRAGEEFCDVCYGRGTKRVRVVEPEMRPVQKKARIKEDKGPDNDEIQIRLAHERRQYQAIQTQKREARIEQGRFVSQVEGLFQEWKNGCSICRIRKRPSNTGHNWKCCPYEQVDVPAIEAAKTDLIEVRWSNSQMCCRQCWAPQAICQSFDPIDNSGRMRYQKTNRKCQFVGVLKEVVAVMLSHSTDDVQEGIKAWIHEQRQNGSIMPEPVEDEWAEVFKPWLGSRIIQGEVEMSGMCWLFCQWAPESVE